MTKTQRFVLSLAVAAATLVLVALKTLDGTAALAAMLGLLAPSPVDPNS